MTFKDKPKRDGGKTISRDRKPKGPGKPAAEREKKPTEVQAAPAPETVGASKPERISKIMARAGVASRRDVERMIMEGRVSLNGVKLDTPVVNATLADKIEVDGMPIRGAERTRLWLYHKPAGLVTTNSDPEGRPTVFDNLPGELPRVLSIGRLDINTEGLLLLTNDGGLSRVLELPTTGWLRRYRVRAHGEVDQAALDKLKEGIAVDGVLYGAIDATLDRTQGHNVWISMGLREGKNREIKNVLGALGLEVNRLIRVSYGPFQLGDLAEGKVLEVRGRMLRDQLGPRLIEQAGANFDAPIYNASVEDEEDNAPKRPVKSEWAKSDAPEGKPRFEKGGKPEDRREKALGRLDTKRGDKPAGKFGSKPAGKFGAKGRSEDEGDDRRPRQPAGTSRTANVWMAPGARPTRDGKERKSSARAEAENLFKKPSAQDEARRNVVRHADAEGEWIRSDSPREEEGGRGRGDRPRGEKSFGDRGGRGGKPFGDRPFRDKPREEGDRPRGDRPRGEKSFGDRPARGGKPFGDRPFRDKPREEGDRPRSDRPRGEKSFGDRTARGEKTFGDRPFRDRPREDGDRPRGDRPAGDKPRGGKPGFGKPSFGKSGERGERSGFSGKSKGPGGPGGGKPGGKGPGGKPSGGRGMTRNADRRR
ncbi:MULTISPECIES: pseudouridine synthase [unclassified Agrobacterium]|uniref:pseudouridine synthase n=1 Tax=unclassified Agrobacterium TaxID=2632611 RepID=UPI002449BACD|nr:MULTISPECIES: pseudouridine synthase [unclassified Agrobacterium]MDH0617060.1 pseudouridine synthase [Agrobacterium sp. GD03872]MDH0699776.1 pseudouridine synthase [Agrobacterium sp. GD03871]MDH1062671.1 pseudouridine synthase [Agrobacterium sp. GD03992]MDH2213961.1 pseudouridine synthase [Agrobacterium sp. GD03643]MDH2222814.1 pseudouridine synthase [Agrobacterium sp. GD03638]